MVDVAQRKCEMCGRVINPENDAWALDKHGDTLCRPCHIQAVLLLKGQGIDWEGQTFGYQLSGTQEFGAASEIDEDNAALVSGSAPVSKQKIGRNEKCPCGSGKKFKKCCGQ